MLERGTPTVAIGEVGGGIGESLSANSPLGLSLLPIAPSSLRLLKANLPTPCRIQGVRGCSWQAAQPFREGASGYPKLLGRLRETLLLECVTQI